MEQPIQTSYAKPAYQQEKPLSREDIRALLKLAAPDYAPSDGLKARIMTAIEKTPQDKPKKE